jgi:hypothetical protein
VGFFDTSAYADALVEGLAKRAPARRAMKIKDIELQHCLKQQKALIAQVA